MLQFIKDSLVNLSAGFVVGAIFAFFKLPVPAPNYIPAVFGILGISLGYISLTYLLAYFMSYWMGGK